jgi:hypothetical protein
MNEPQPGELEEIPGITDDPVIRLIYTGQAQTLSEAEEMYLTASLDEAEALAASSLTNDELREHPLIQLFATRAGRG